MKINYKKILSVAGSVLMVGSTVGFAMAAGGGFPTPFVDDNTPNYALVVGASAAATDMTGANSINDYLNTFYSIESTDESSVALGGDFSDSVGVREDEIELGDSITPLIPDTLTDSKIATLLDSEFSWNDGDGSDTYDFHEEIHLMDGDSKLVIRTNLDDKELIDDVVLENYRALSYRYVLDKDLDITAVDNETADPLYLTILGKEYEILKMGPESITVSFSDERIVKTGDVITVDGVTLTIGDIFLGSVEVNDVLIREERTRTVNGIEVYIDTIAYHSSSDLPSKVIIKVGRDISQTISDDKEYIEDDETWKWDINLDPEEGEKPYIGVKYDIKSVSYDEDEDAENAISIGEQYVLPENYGAVVFEGLTDVDYEDFEVSFNDETLYSGTEQVGENQIDVAILEGENDDSIVLRNLDGTKLYETDTVYFEYVNDTSFKVYFKDIDGEISDVDGRKQLFSDFDSMKLIVGDTEMAVTIVNNELILTTEGDLGETISMPLGITESVRFTHLGVGAEGIETATDTDILVNVTKIGTREDDVLTHYGTIVRDPEDNADSDRVIMSIPDEQVFARVSVLGQGMAVEEVSDVETDGNETIVEEVPQLGGLVIKDNEVGAHTSKNLIIVGGSCINTEAARLLGGKACGSDFTLKTGVTTGQYIIQTFDDAGRIAIVVAGYEAADTTRGVTDFIASETDFSVAGAKLVA